MWYDVKKGRIGSDKMANKVFNKKLPRYCEYCIHANCSQFSDEVLCLKKGITNRKDSCRHYKYDPLKREPQGSKISNNYKPEDFLL